MLQRIQLQIKVHNNLITKLLKNQLLNQDK